MEVPRSDAVNEVSEREMIMRMTQRDIDNQKKLIDIAAERARLRATDPAVLSPASQKSMANLPKSVRDSINNARRRMGKDPIQQP
jgi:hypothetical protein